MDLDEVLDLQAEALVHQDHFHHFLEAEGLDPEDHLLAGILAGVHPWDQEDLAGVMDLVQEGLQETGVHLTECLVPDQEEGIKEDQGDQEDLVVREKRIIMKKVATMNKDQEENNLVRRLEMILI